MGLYVHNMIKPRVFICAITQEGMHDLSQLSYPISHQNIDHQLSPRVLKLEKPIAQILHLHKRQSSSTSFALKSSSPSAHLSSKTLPLDPSSLLLRIHGVSHERNCQDADDEDIACAHVSPLIFFLALDVPPALTEQEIQQSERELVDLGQEGGEEREDGLDGREDGVEDCGEEVLEGVDY